MTCWTSRITRKGEDLYAILPHWKGGNFRLKDLQVQEGTTVSLLGTTSNIEWRADGKDVVVTMPAYPAAGDAPTPVHNAWVLKLSGALAN
jgi:alpha-L-fucosidase